MAEILRNRVEDDFEFYEKVVELMGDGITTAPEASESLGMSYDEFDKKLILVSKAVGKLEREVKKLLADGLDVSQIANHLNVSVDVVRELLRYW